MSHLPPRHTPVSSSPLTRQISRSPPTEFILGPSATATAVYREIKKELPGALIVYSVDASGRKQGICRYHSLLNMKHIEQEFYYKDDVIHGPYKSWHVVQGATGKLCYEATWVAGKPDGEERYYYPNGTLKAVYKFKAGKKHGEFKTWYHTGAQQQFGTYIEGERAGVFQVWDPAGKLVSEHVFKPSSDSTA
jgi:antitoxin component YwqK of YwqJK toxin-antitoxin module